MNKDPLKSAQPCGCDEGANWTCEWHRYETGERYTFPNHPIIPNRTVKFGPCDKEAALAAETTGFITKDSGERQQFASGMQRDTTTGKWLFHLVFFGPMFMRWVGLLTRGAVKYEENNWMKANGDAERRRFIQSAVRHFSIWVTYRLTGVNIEDPTAPSRLPLTEDHAAAVFFNINGAEYVEDRMNTPKTLEEVAAKEYRPGGPGGQVCCGQPGDCVSAGCVFRVQHEKARQAQAYEAKQRDAHRELDAMDQEIRRFHAADAPYAAAHAEALGKARLNQPAAIPVSAQGGVTRRQLSEIGAEEGTYRIIIERERY